MVTGVISQAVRAEPLQAAGEHPREVVERFASHKDYDRLVLSGSDAVTAVSSSDGTSLAIKLSPSVTIKTIPRCGRRLTTVKGGVGSAVISLVKGAQVHTWRKDGMLVIDVLDPAKHSGAAASLTRVALAPTPPQKTSGVVSNDPVSAASKNSSVATRSDPEDARAGPRWVSQAAGLSNIPPLPTSSMPVLSGSETLPPPNPAAVSFLDEADVPGPAILLPISSKVGAAAFSRGGEGHVVFEQPQVFDLSPLKDSPVFGSMMEAVLPGGTHLHFNLPRAGQLHLVQHHGNWAVSLSPAVALSSGSPIVGRKRAGSLFFDLRAPGRVVVLDDDVTGGRLFVGTERDGGQHVIGRHVSAELAVLPTWQGLVVEPASDRLVFQSLKDGFQISVPDLTGLSSLWPDQIPGSSPDRRAMTRMFDFSGRSVADHNLQLKQALQDAAGSPRTARYPARLRVAQAMLAEGLDVEAAAVVRAAVADDPRHRNDPVATGLSAIATWLSAQAGGVVSTALPINVTAFDGSDEATLWRALLSPGQPNEARQAAALATTWPVLLAYPQSLRRFMLRPAAALLQAGSQDKAWAAFLNAFPDASLDLSRASYLESRGNTDESLALLDKVGQHSNRLNRAEALALAVEERLKAGRITPAMAATKLESYLFAWRGDSRELALRERVAILDTESGSWRKAITALDEAGALFPDQQASIRDVQASIIDTLLRGDQAAKLNALDLVSLAELAAKLPSNLDQSRFAPMLAEKLLALDLPDQAEPIVRALFSRTQSAQSKAEVGFQLAELQAGRGDASGALAILDESTDVGLASPAIASRALLRGRLLASVGRPADALALLAGQSGPKARELEVAIMETQHDWQGAAGVLDRMASEHDFTTLPEASQQELLVHITRDRSEAGDRVGLRRLSKTYGARFRLGPNAALFAVLTAEPVQNTADLPRSASEIAAMHALPASLSRPAP